MHYLSFFFKKYVFHSGKTECKGDFLLENSHFHRFHKNCKMLVFPSENADFPSRKWSQCRFSSLSPRRKYDFSTQKVENPSRKALMGQEKSFNDIFVKQLLKDLWPQKAKAHAPSELIDSSPAHMAYLLGELETFHTKNDRGQTHYNQQKLKPLPRKAHILTDLQKQAFDFIRQFIPELSHGFSKQELKKAFRQLAKEFHPDLTTATNAPERFRELKASYDSLSTLF